MIGKFYGDSVVLRWAPSDAILWRAYNKSGYILERIELPENITGNLPRVRLSPSAIKPWTMDEWKARINTRDTMAAVAITLLYGKTNTPVAKPVKKTKSTDVDLAKAVDQKYDLENRYSFAIFIADELPHLANGLGLRYVDKTIAKGKRYLYSIHPLTDPKLIKSDSAAVVVGTSALDVKPAMPEIRYTEMDRTVTFKWNRKLAGTFFTSYFYERSVDGGKTFQRRNYKPYVQPRMEGADLNDEILLTDSLPKNYFKYFYRIVGITPFGDLGEYSPSMDVVGKDKISPEAPQKVIATHLGKRNVKITWEKSVKEKDFAGFVVGRAESANGTYIPLSAKLLAPASITFTDTAAVTWGTNYYVVSAVDTAGNAGISIPAYVTMIDTIAPAKPTGLQGKIDTTGIVKIKWNLGKERDLMGYLVYYANAKDHTFTALTKGFLADSVFTDSISLNTLSEKIYYRIAAFDKNRNPSKYSDILELKKPDKIKPVSPVFTTFHVSDTTVILSWSPSSSADVADQILYRKEDGKDWLEVARLTKTIATYTDNKVQKATWYEYSLIANDDDGNRSERSFPLRARVYDSGIRKKIEGFSVKLRNDNRTVDLAWRYSSKDDFHFLIYRGYNGHGLEMYRQVDGSTFSITDSEISKGKYEYAIKAIYKDGGQSPLVKYSGVEVK